MDLVPPLAPQPARGHDAADDAQAEDDGQGCRGPIRIGHRAAPVSRYAHLSDATMPNVNIGYGEKSPIVGSSAMTSLACAVGQPLPRLIRNCAPDGATRRMQSPDRTLLQIPEGRAM